MNYKFLKKSLFYWKKTLDSDFKQIMIFMMHLKSSYCIVEYNILILTSKNNNIVCFIKQR